MSVHTTGNGQFEMPYSLPEGRHFNCVILMLAASAQCTIKKPSGTTSGDVNLHIHCTAAAHVQKLAAAKKLKQDAKSAHMRTFTPKVAVAVSGSDQTCKDSAALASMAGGMTPAEAAAAEETTKLPCDAVVKIDSMKYFATEVRGHTCVKYKASSQRPATCCFVYVALWCPQNWRPTTPS